MKKTSILILFFIISCTASQEDSLKKTANLSIEKEIISNTTTTLENITTTTVNIDLMRENFKNAWETILKDPIQLNLEETELTNYLYELWTWKGDKWTPEEENFYELRVNGLSCYRIWNAMGWAWLDEVHPIDGDYSRGYWAVERYICGDNISLFGAPFYYENSWWIYQSFEFSWDMVDCEDPCGTGVGHFAKRVQIDLDDDIYKTTLPDT